MLITRTTHRCEVCNKDTELHALKEYLNLARKNMLNVKRNYKKNPCVGVFNILDDSYVSLVKYEDFVSEIDKYIENATSKRERYEEFVITKRL